MRTLATGGAACFALLLAACGGGQPRATAKTDAATLAGWKDETSSSGGARAGAPTVAIVNATLWTAAGEPIAPGTLVLSGGRIEAVGKDGDVKLPSGAQVIDAKGAYVTPGIIDTHSHMGVYAVPGVTATDDGNEATDPVTAQVWAGDSFWPQDPSLRRALAAGVTTIQVLPGSANLIGGRGAIVKLRPGLSVGEMRFPGAPDTLKMACGENPKRVYGGGKNSAPSTRMGNVAGYKKAFQDATEYRRSWADWKKKHDKWAAKQGPVAKSGPAAKNAKGDKKADDDNEEPTPPHRDFAMETLAGVLDGSVLVQMHCYRADEMLRMMEIAKDFGFKIRAFHHAVEAYKIRDRLAANDVGINTWPDWWGFKLEAFDAIPENLALLTEAGVHTVLHSDSEMLVQRLHQEAGKARAFGRRAGVDVTEDQALRWITANAAWVLGIDKHTGTLEAGKMADVVIWEGYPLSYQAHAAKVFVDGELLFDRGSENLGHPESDFELGWFERDRVGQGTNVNSKESK